LKRAVKLSMIWVSLKKKTELNHEI
jgi:hypothetical protein